MMVLDSKNITVLMIDDDEINRQMAEMILTRKLPYKVLTADSGMRGIELMHQYEVNLVLLDVTMPVWDGFKTLSVIRSDSKLKDTPVIMLTASAERDSVIKASQYGVDDYIRKPFVPEELISRVSKVAWEHWQEESLDSLSLDIDDLMKNLGGTP